MYNKAREKVIKLFDDYITFHLRLNIKQNMEKDSKY